MELFNTIISTVSLITSLIISGFAIWLAFTFYHKSKDAEKNVNEALTEIKTHASALERLTGRWMDRLTKHVTSPQPADEVTNRLFELITITHTANLRLPTPDDEAKITEIISSYIAIYYYCSLTNIASQGYLPKIEDVEENSIKTVVDQSYNDCNYLYDILLKADQKLIEKNPLNHLYQQALQLKESIKDSTMVYSERAKDSQSESII